MRSRPIRVLHVITDLSGGGAQGVLHRLCLRGTDTEHAVVSLMDAGTYGPLLEAAGVSVTTLGLRRGRLHWRGVRRLWQLVRALRPDVVQTWMYHADVLGGLAARLAGCANVAWNVRQTRLDAKHAKRSTIAVGRVAALLSRHVPRVIVCCADAVARAHAANGYAADKLLIIPNGFDLDRFRPDDRARDELRASWNVAPTVPLVGMVARVAPPKDHATLVKAVALLASSGHDFRTVLVGSGATDANGVLTALLRDHGLDDRVLLAGERRDIASVMNALDVHVLSSASEGFPNVLAEAMACGTPCVASDVGDAANIVGSNGWSVQPADPVALANAIGDALSTMQERAAWRARGHAARERIATHYGIDRMVSAYRAMWSTMATPSEPA